MTNHCCDMMRSQIAFHCEQHANPFECPDSVIHFDETANTYGLIIHDGGNSSISITHCPWCGSALMGG